MKNWRANYTVRFMDGHVEEYTDSFEAETIEEAFKLGKKHADDLMWLEKTKSKKRAPSVMIDRIVMWSVTMIDMDVF